MSNSHPNNGAGNGSARTIPPLENILRGRRILLTGGTGFLGKVFLYLLLRWHPEVEKVYLLIRGDRRSSQNRFRREILDSPVLGPLREHLGTRFDHYMEEKIAILPGDITDEGLLATDAPPLKKGAIDAVVHSAGLVNFEASLEKAIAINATGVDNVIDFCKKHAAALLHVSTCYVAGEADGHRFEDDVAFDWCPKGSRNFNLRREIRDAIAAVARVEAESRDQAHQAEFHSGLDDEDHVSDGAAESKRKRWADERLKEIGRARSLRWGWPNTYSYTKSLGEQLVFAARDSIDATVVRPAVIESALADPFPGWNQGVNTSAPLTYLSGEGYRFYPAKAELVLDVIPVDLAAHAMIPILAALLAKRHKPVYQLCTSDRNPLPMRRLVELTALTNRRDHRNDRGSKARMSKHLEAVVVSQRTYDLASSTAPELLTQAASALQSIVGEDSPRARKFRQRAEQIRDNAEMARSMVEVYRPYIQELVYTFHGNNIRDLYARMSPGDVKRHPFRPDKIDWQDYWMNIHLPGLRRHIFPQLDLHTRGRPRGLKRHRTLIDLLEAAAADHGSRPALIARTPSGERSTVSFRELRDGAHLGGMVLRKRGIEPGDRVLLVAENGPGWVVAYFAIISAGAIAVPLDHQISSEELAPICQTAKPKAAIRSSAVASRLGNGIAEAAGAIIELDVEELRRPFLLGAKAPDSPDIERKTLASILFTSGTTGAPKGVMLSHGNFCAEVAALSRVFVLDHDDVVLSLLPLHHTFEFTCGMLLPLASGATIVYPQGVEAANLSRTLADVRPTALIGVPALWEAVHRRIVDQVEERGPFFAAAFNNLRDLNRRFDRDYGVNIGSVIFRQAHNALGGKLRLAVSGGAALPNRVAEFFNDIGIRLLEGYGLTEASPVLTAAHPDEPAAPGSVGKPLAGVEIKIDSEDGAGVGEIIARGPNVMSGYYHNTAATEAVLKEGWLHTGDLGRVDEEGRLYIVGRAKDVIVDSGGNNIYIDELEEAYGHSAYVKELAIVGLTVGQGEQAAALVAPAYSRGESRRSVEDKLRTHFEEVGANLSAHKRVRILRFTDHELPRTRTRKIKRFEVAAMIRHMIEGPGPEQASSGGDLEPWLAQALAQFSGGAYITPSTRLIEDLGLDSLALAELGEAIAERAGREITPEEMSDITTVDDLQQRISQGQSRPRLPSYARFAQPYTLTLPGPLKRLGTTLFRGAQEMAFRSWLAPTILGRGNIPSNRNFLVVANHASHLDFGLLGYALGATGRKMVVLAAKDYFFNTNLRRFIASNFTTLIPFDRERAQMESLDEAMAELAAGANVLMFPEGTRSPDGEIHEFKSGAGYLALKSRCDVLPISIKGTYEVMGKGSLVPKKHPVEIRIGRVLSAEEMRVAVENGDGAGAYRKLAELMRSAVVALANGSPRVAPEPAESPAGASGRHRAGIRKSRGNATRKPRRAKL